MNVKLIGLLEHDKPNHLHFSAVPEEPEEPETGANHFVQALHRSINDLSARKCFQQTRYIQVDFCTRENNSPYIFAYIEPLVDGGNF